MVEHDGFVLAPEHVENLFFLGDAGHGLIDDFELFERLRRGVQLADSAVDQDQARHRLAFRPAGGGSGARPPRACWRNRREQAGGFVRAFRHRVAANDEFAVVGLLHSAVFPHDHRSDRVRSLNVRNVEASRCAWAARAGRARIASASAMAFELGFSTRKRCMKECLRVFLHQLEERVLLPALRVQDFHAMSRRVSVSTSSSSSRSSKSIGTWM